MSILASLAKAYERLPDAPPFGYSTEKIGFLISLNEDGSPAGMPHDLRDDSKKRSPRLMLVPQAVKRTAGISPNFLWDKSSYVLGVTLGEGHRVAEEHAAFVRRHTEALAGSDDQGLLALLAFLEAWEPERFAELGWPEAMKDQNIVFALESDRLQDVRIHDRGAAKALWARLSSSEGRDLSVCLVSGERAATSLLHPSIKGVWGGQTAGASIVSFNAKSYESYGHEQGANAPVSEAVTFAYTTALNLFLRTGSRNRIQIGDASTVFWADASSRDTAEVAESVYAGLFGAEDAKTFDTIDETGQAKRVGVLLEKLRQGMPLKDFAPDLAEGVRFYVLGLAPNAARISIRFWLENDFGTVARNYQRFIADMAIDPPPRDPFPALWKYLAETAVLKKRENVPPNLAGEWMRAILNGTPYPLTLLATVLMRIRADGDVNGLRVAMLRAILIRNLGKSKEEAPVSLDLNNKNKGYLLGRLFATYEQAQSAALGRNVNATLKDKFYGAASAQPRRVFALLERNSANHLSKVGKLRAGQRVNLEKAIGAIFEGMDPNEDPFPASLPAEDQALFGLGYYHQRNDFFRKPELAGTEENAQ